MKKYLLSAAVSLVLLAGLRPGLAKAEAEASLRDAHAQPPLRDFASEVRGVFATKCTGCHGPGLAKPKGRFGYVLDLRRIAANPEMVIPGQPDESELWTLIQRDEMPPDDSPRGVLTPAQKEVIRAWIAAGAPGASESVSLVGSEPTTSVPMEVPTADRILRWLGKFHLLLLHFPIALVVAAGVGEVLSIWQRIPLPSGSVRFCLWLAALAAIPTVGLGWLFAAAGNGAGSPELLLAHRWLGTTAAVCLVITAVCAERDVRRGVRSRSAQVLLMSGILITALTAHFGGLLALGADFFAF